jgi:hypothetical protein
VIISSVENQIKYNKADHSYIRKSDGKLLAGVSSVSDLGKSKESGGYLKQWAVNETIKYIKDSSIRFVGYGESSGKSEKEFLKVLKEAKYIYKEIGKDAMDIGTYFHDYLERYIKSKLNKTAFKEPIENDSLKGAFKDFQKWELDNAVEWVASELLVGDPIKLELAGRLDALAYVNGVLTIIDFKVANSISPTYYLQTAGYWLCLEAMGCEIGDRLIIRLPKTKKKKVWENDEYKMVDNKIEFLKIPTEIEFDKKTFINLREGYRWINQQILKNGKQKDKN